MKHNCTIELHEAQLRATPARIAVMNFLETTNHPVDVSMVRDYLDRQQIGTDPATVFRMMNMFMEKGIVKQISFNEGKFRYELSSKPDHHHLLCESCGAIEDFSDCAISTLETDIMKRKGFFVKSHSLEFYGLCKKCRAQ